MLADSLLFPHLRALDNVAYGPRSRGVGRHEARDRARTELERVGLSDRAGSRPRELSSGQQARVALARALATDPALLLLDEPLAALDPDTRAPTRSDLAARLTAYDGVTVLVTHDAHGPRARPVTCTLSPAGTTVSRRLSSSVWLQTLRSAVAHRGDRSAGSGGWSTVMARPTTSAMLGAGGSGRTRSRDARWAWVRSAGTACGPVAAVVRLVPPAGSSAAATGITATAASTGAVIATHRCSRARGRSALRWRPAGNSGSLRGWGWSKERVKHNGPVRYELTRVRRRLPAAGPADAR